MSHKKIIIAAFILLLGLIIFWRCVFFQSSREEKIFNSLYIVEIPPRSKYLADHSSDFYNILQSFRQEDFFAQKIEDTVPALLQIFDVQYVLLRDREYWKIFEPFLDYSPGEEKTELPKTFPVKKETLNSLGKPFLIMEKAGIIKKTIHYLELMFLDGGLQMKQLSSMLFLPEL